MIYTGSLLITGGLLLMAAGIVGLFTAGTFYRKMLTASLVDTAGLLLLLLGAAVYQGIGFFGAKILLTAAAVFLTAPLITHKLSRSAYLAGHREGDES